MLLENVCVFSEIAEHGGRAVSALQVNLIGARKRT
jgi:hypothetical protein